jgi:hypothetical protein
VSARIGYIALCLVGFLLSSELVRAALPGQGTPLTETKLAHFAEHTDDYDTLFFGSSRAYRGIAPEVFDATLADEGIECRTFSFGAPGARATDIYNTLCKLQRLQPTGLRFVFIDPERLEFLAGHDDMLQSSVVDWHDAESSWLAVKYVLAAGQPPAPCCGRSASTSKPAFIARPASEPLTTRSWPLSVAGPTAPSSWRASARAATGGARSTSTRPRREPGTTSAS